MDLFCRLEPCYVQDGGILELVHVDQRPDDQPVYYPHGLRKSKEAIYFHDSVHAMIQGEYSIDWVGGQWKFSFANARDAMLFKLTWL